jgi:hypothetical protein
MKCTEMARDFHGKALLDDAAPQARAGLLDGDHRREDDENECARQTGAIQPVEVRPK